MYRAMGHPEQKQAQQIDGTPDIRRLENVPEGALFILHSDGLNGMENKTLQKIIKASTTQHPANIIRSLLTQIHKAAEDNVTVVALRVSS
jgi:serine/threonine protein phosphatase PrpC